MRLIKCDKCGALINERDRDLWTRFGLGLNVGIDSQDKRGYDKSFYGELCVCCADKIRQELEPLFGIKIETRKEKAKNKME